MRIEDTSIKDIDLSCCKIEKRVETHISWLIFTDDKVYKVKKPVKFPFLDFSTKEKRQYFCQQELDLNRRFSPEIYLGLVTLEQQSFEWKIGDEIHQHIIDDQMEYALVMKRVPDDYLLLKLLKEQRVDNLHLEKLAHKIAEFHNSAPEHRTTFKPDVYKKSIDDTLMVQDYLSSVAGKSTADILQKCSNEGHKFVNDHNGLLEERFSKGFIKDLHGDLHSGNIFLMEDPILFDCIEFNPDFRRIDMLCELSFLCTDLEAFGYSAEADRFIKAYLEKVNKPEAVYHHELYFYYKMYAADVRIKVHGIKAMQAEKENKQHNHLEEMKPYLKLADLHADELNA